MPPLPKGEEQEQTDSGLRRRSPVGDVEHRIRDRLKVGVCGEHHRHSGASHLLCQVWSCRDEHATLLWGSGANDPANGACREYRSVFGAGHHRIEERCHLQLFEVTAQEGRGRPSIGDTDHLERVEEMTQGVRRPGARSGSPERSRPSHNRRAGIRSTMTRCTYAAGGGVSVAAGAAPPFFLFWLQR